MAAFVPGCVAMAINAAAVETPVDPQIEAMRGAGDARVVVADHRFAALPQLIIGPVKTQRFDGQAQILFDARLILTGGRDDARIAYQSIDVQFVTMPEYAARRFGDNLR